MDEAYDLVRQTFARRNETCPVSRTLFESIADSEILRESREIFCAMRDGTLAAFVVLLKFQRTLYYGISATHTDALSLGANSLLIWEVVKAFGNSEWNVLDFVGANIPSISRFKEGFNPKLVLHFQAELSTRYARLGRNLAKLIRK